MPLEFDPSTSTYYATAYTGPTVQEPVESPPPQQTQSPPPPPPEETREAYTDPPPPPEDPSLQSKDKGYPGDVGTIVDEVV